MQKVYWAAVACLLGFASASHAGDVQVAVNGIADDTGQIGCGLHLSDASFPMGTEGVTSVWVKPNGTRANCLFEDVPAGTYAIAVVHDLNGNRTTDTNFVGLPKEAWGVSKNIRPALRAPRFAESAFVVTERTVTLDIEVR